MSAHTHLDGPAPRQRLVDPLVIHAHPASDRDRGQGVDRVVASRKAEPEPPIAVDLEPPALFGRPPPRELGIGVVGLAEEHDRHRAVQAAPKGRRVRVDHGQPLAVEVAKQRGLLARDGLHRAEALEVGAADHGDHADVGAGDLGQLADLPRLVGADLQHPVLVV